MIESEREYEATKAQLARLEASLEKARTELPARDDIPDLVRQGHVNGILMLMDDLRAELAESEQSHPHRCSLLGAAKPFIRRSPVPEEQWDDTVAQAVAEEFQRTTGANEV